MRRRQVQHGDFRVNPLVRFRPASTTDAGPLAALAMLVFLETYAVRGVRADLAREAFHHYSEDAFLTRLTEAERKFVVAEDEGLVGFAEVICEDLRSPAAAVRGGELVRLYVQPRAQRAGIGRGLILAAEKLGAAASLPCLWLTVWEGNAGALAFYRSMGYAEVGATTYSFEGNSYGNLVLAKQLVLR